MEHLSDSNSKKINWPTPAESINVSTPKKKYKPKPWPDPNIPKFSKISQSHRKPRKITPSIFDLPPVFPKTGLISDRKFKQIVTDIFKDILKCDDGYTGNEMITKLCEFMIRKKQKNQCKL